MTSLRHDHQQQIDARIIAAADAGDHVALCDAYMEWGFWLLEEGAVDEACFYLTQSYVLALEHDLDSAARLHALLVRHGREHPGSGLGERPESRQPVLNLKSGKNK